MLTDADPGFWEYYEDFLPNPSDLFERLNKEIQPYLSQPSITLYDRTCPIPRLLSYHHMSGNNVMYPYTAESTNSQPFTPVLKEIYDILIEKTNDNRYNSVLVNYYRDGKDYIAWHSDKEAKDKSRVASISLGQERKFRLRYTRKDENGKQPVVKEFKLKSGSLFIMLPGCQRKYQHCIPKELRIKNIRINLTFRVI